MNKWLRITCIAFMFLISGFYLYKTTTGIEKSDIACMFLWLILGIIECSKFYAEAFSNGLETANEILNKAIKKVSKEIEESKESEGEDEN